MKNYVLEYYNEPNTGDISPEDFAASWQAWFGKVGANLVDAGNPFAPGGQAVEKSGVTTIENYPSTGYSIIKAESMEAAVELAKASPLLNEKGAVIRVYETLPM
jgi:hypothetical protein